MKPTETMRHNGTQTVAYDGSVACTNPFGAQTRYVRVSANSACHIAFGASPTASTSEAFLPANWVEVIKVAPGEKIAAIKAASNGLVTATAGTLTVTELTF